MNRVWMIAEAGHGLGRVLAEAVLQAGDRVAAGAAEPASLAALSARWPTRVRALRWDAQDEATHYLAVDTALQTFGRLDVAVHHVVDADADSADDLALRAHIEAGFFGAVALAHAALPSLRAQRHGLLLHLAPPAAASASVPGAAARRAALEAVRGYYATLDADACRDGVRLRVADVSTAAATRLAVHAGLLPDALLAAIDSLPRQAAPASARVLAFPQRTVAA